ncbi:hypothetical protein [Mycobacteroides abscessus]
MLNALTGARRLDTIIREALRDTRLTPEDRSTLQSLRAQAQHATKTLDTPQAGGPDEASHAVADWVGLIAARTQEILGNYQPAGQLAAELQAVPTAAPKPVDLVPTPIPMPKHLREPRTQFDRLMDAMMFGILPAYVILIFLALAAATIRWILGYGFTDEIPIAVAIPVFSIVGLLAVAGVYSQYRHPFYSDEEHYFTDLDADAVPPLVKGKLIRPPRNR